METLPNIHSLSIQLKRGKCLLLLTKYLLGIRFYSQTFYGEDVFERTFQTSAAGVFFD